MATVPPPHVLYWESRWKENKTQWHIDAVHPILLEFLNQLTAIPAENEAVSTTGIIGRKIFVPLCGKSIDMIYLLSQGFEVFGVECVSQPIEEFQKENDIKLKFDEKDSVYSTEDAKLKIYLGDLFKCPIEKWGPFDYIWDRGSFVAIGYEFRSTYLSVMQRSLKKSDSGADENDHDFHYLLDTVKYDKNKYGGPPHCVDATDLEKYFSTWTNIQVLNETELSADSALRKVTGLSVEELPCDNIVYLLTPKNNVEMKIKTVSNVFHFLHTSFPDFI